MPDTFPLGSIPPLSAWEGETLTFTVTSKLKGSRFSKRATPAPKGKMSINELKGIFTYAPAPEDKDEFTVWIRAQRGPKDEKQKVLITPRPKLTSEFNIIEHVSETPPDATSKFYMTYSEKDAGQYRFNHIMEDSSKPGGEPVVMTKQVAVAGVKLVIEKNDDKGSLYNKLKDRTNLRELTICADEIVIRCPLEVPGTDVNLYARTLRFEDPEGEVGSINTSPLPIKTRSTLDEALDGQKAGDIRVMVQNLEAPGNAVRFIANGSNGQEARQGLKGKNGTSVSTWGARITVKPWTGSGSKTLDYTREIRDLQTSRKPEEQRVPIGADVYRNRELEFATGPRTFPTDGEEPKALPGRPGQGGDGGLITTSFRQKVESIAQQKRGEMGAMSPDLAETKGGEPRIAIWLQVTYRAEVGGITKGSAGRIAEKHTKSYPGVKAQPAAKPAAKNGEIIVPADKSFWLNPMSVRAVIAYAKDMMLTGHANTVREMVKTYLDDARAADEAYRAADKDHKGNIDWTVLTTELEALVQQMDGPYDYFGNPAGWVPMLSFQANHTLYKNEIGVAIRSMFLAYWVENKHARTEKAVKVRDDMMKQLRGETDKALAAYSSATDKVSRLDGEIDGIKTQIGQLQNDLETRVHELKRQATEDLKVEHFWRSSAKILGGVMELIPVGQPVLGAFGKSFTVLSDIDLDNPKGSLGDLAGAWSKVGKEKIAPKFSGLWAKLKSAKEKEEKVDEKKEKFKKALAKEQLEEDVETHMKEQKAAKKSIIGAFSGFAVSEDDVKERLEKVQAECPAYKEIVEKVEALNKRKAAFLEDMFAALEEIDEATATILNNQLALIELRAEISDKLEHLNLEALQYVRGMGQRARQRLLLYQYYLVKSYHYLMLEKLPIIDFRATKMFDAFVKVLVEQPNKEKKEVNLLEVSDDGMLTDKQYEALSAVFEDQLREIANRIVTFYQGNSARTTGSFLLELTSEELETLNGPARRVEFDLLPRLDKRREDIRFTKISVDSVELGSPLPAQSKNLSLEYLHDGLSRIRKAGKLYLFRPGDYGDTSEQRDRGKTYWSTDVSYNPKLKDVDKRLSWEESTIDPEAQSLVRYLIGTGGGEKSPLLSFRPSGWTTLAVSRSGDYQGKLGSLTLRVAYVYQRVDNSLSTVVVRVEDGAQPYIRCNSVDLNGHGDGQGNFVRTFKKNKGSVTLVAPSQYGRRAFLGWRVDPDSDGESGSPDGSNQLKKSQALTLNLNKTPDYLVEAVFEPVNFVPVNEKDEKWPDCPYGWEFEDWIFVNRTNQPLMIPRVFSSSTGQEYPIGVNEPLGSNFVRLSFERLNLAAGESTKISACVNPVLTLTMSRGVLRSQGIELAFVVQAAEEFRVFFDRSGHFYAVSKKLPQNKGWTNAADAFEVDKDNRTITLV